MASFNSWSLTVFAFKIFHLCTTFYHHWGIICCALSPTRPSSLAKVDFFFFFHSPAPFSTFLTFCLWFSLVFSLLHSASQKHSLNPMHESHLAHLKLSKVRVQIVCPPCVSDSQHFQGAGHTNSNTARMQSHTADLCSSHLSSTILTQWLWDCIVCRGVLLFLASHLPGKLPLTR